MAISRSDLSETLLELSLFRAARRVLPSALSGVVESEPPSVRFLAGWLAPRFARVARHRLRTFFPAARPPWVPRLDRLFRGAVFRLASGPYRIGGLGFGIYRPGGGGHFAGEPAALVEGPGNPGFRLDGGPLARLLCRGAAGQGDRDGLPRNRICLRLFC